MFISSELLSYFNSLERKLWLSLKREGKSEDVSTINISRLTAVAKTTFRVSARES
jgi:hypothetical protein